MRQRRTSILLLISALSILVFAFFLRSKNETLQPVPVPIENQQSIEKIKLGKALFFDVRLSPDNSISCSSCHDPQLAFTDGKKLSEGFQGRHAMRNAPTLLNVGYLPHLMFDNEVKTLEMQSIVPLKDTAEMANEMNILIQKLHSIPAYSKAAKKIFNRDFDAYVLTRSLAAFQRTLISNNTPFDQFLNGDEEAINKSAKIGWKLFSEKLYCTACHTPPYFTNFMAENNGLYASYKDKTDKGRFRIHGDTTDIGRFKVPTLRNISKTAPYMHDGSISTLPEVIDHYSKGGNGHFNQSKRITSFNLSTQDKKDLITFLNSLSDPE